MNQAYCPECQTELTKSIVGYLCHGCGSVFGFEKTSGDSPISTSSSSASSGANNSTKAPPKTSSFARHQSDMHQAPKQQGKVTHHIKKFVVPKLATESELPKPVNEDHLLSKPESAPSITAKPAQKINDPEENKIFVPAPPSAAMKEEFSADVAGTALAYNETETAAATTSTASTYLVPALAGILVVAALFIAYMVLR
jgi:hypothetical protein